MSTSSEENLNKSFKRQGRLTDCFSFDAPSISCTYSCNFQIYQWPIQATHSNFQEVDFIPERVELSNRIDSDFFPVASSSGKTKKCAPVGRPRKRVFKSFKKVWLKRYRSSEGENLRKAEDSSLPVIPGRVPGFETIAQETIEQLLKGKYNNKIDNCEIVDCRFPYEYEGGHIQKSVNVFTREKCMNLLGKSENDRKANTLIFYSELSRGRGPTLCRYLQQQDRLIHRGDVSPLTYPEVYLLDGGYKEFYDKYKDLCCPESYKTMADPYHEEELFYYRLIAKTGENAKPSLIIANQLVNNN